MEDSFAELVDAATKNDLRTVKSIVEEKRIPLLRSRLWEIAQIAAQKGNLDVMRYVVELDPSTIEEKNESGETLAQVAAENGHLDALRCIVREKPHILRKKSLKGETIAHIAARKGHLDIIRFIADEDLSILAKKDSQGRTAIHMGVENNVLDTETLKLLDKKGISLLTMTKSGDTIASLAARNGNLDILQYVSRRKPSAIHRALENGETVAHVAAQYGHLHIIQYVAEKAPTIFELKNKGGLTAAHVAAKYGHLDVIRCVAEKVPSILQTYGESLAQIACNNGHLDVIKYVLQNNESILKKLDNNGNTIVHRVVQKNLTDVKTLKFFVEERGVPLSMVNSKNETIADFATRNGNPDIIQYIREKEPSLLNAKERVRRSVSLASTLMVPRRTEYTREGVASRLIANRSGDEMKTKSSLGGGYGNRYPLMSFLTIATFVFRRAKWPLSIVRPTPSPPADASCDEINDIAVEAIETFQYYEHD